MRYGGVQKNGFTIFEHLLHPLVRNRTGTNLFRSQLNRRIQRTKSPELPHIRSQCTNTPVQNQKYPAANQTARSA